MLRSNDPERWRTMWRVTDHGCWEWTGPKDKYGYGEFSTGGRTFRAHRVVYTGLVGPIPDGLEIDHVKDRGCTLKACVNPAHLEPVTHAENVRRGESGLHNAVKTHCPKGHPYEGENLQLIPGGRGCATCIRESHVRAVRKYRAKNGSPYQGTTPPSDRTHCPQGHEYTPENTIRRKGGGRRSCRECSRASARDYMRRKRLEATQS